MTMKDTIEYSESTPSLGLPDVLGFRLVDNFHFASQSEQRSRSTTMPHAPLFGTTTTTHRSPQERRQHLLRVLESAIAILNEDEDMNEATPTVETRARPSRNPLPPGPTN